MKKLLALLLTLALSLTAVCALAEETVTALGSSNVSLTPDLATFTVGVTTQDASVTSAQAANAKTMQSVLDALYALNVAESDVRTENYGVNALYGYSNGKIGDQQYLKGYEVSNGVTVTVRDIAQLGSLLDATVAAGANQTYGLSFQSTQNAAAYDQALQAATKEALRKAELIAQATGKTVADVLSLTEQNGGSAFYTANTTYDIAAASTPIEVGTLTVTATVEAVVSVE